MSLSCTSTPISNVTRDYLRTFKAEIGIFGPKLRVLGEDGQNSGRGGAMLIPTNSFLVLGVLGPTTVPRLTKIDEEMRP